MNKNELRARFERALKETAFNKKIEEEKLIWVRHAQLPEPFGVSIGRRAMGERVLFANAGNFEGDLWQLWYIPADADMALIKENLPIERTVEFATQEAISPTPTEKAAANADSALDDTLERVDSTKPES